MVDMYKRTALRDRYLSNVADDVVSFAEMRKCVSVRNGRVEQCPKGLKRVRRQCWTYRDETARNRMSSFINKCFQSPGAAARASVIEEDLRSANSRPTHRSPNY